jgi:hypothetical protein
MEHETNHTCGGLPVSYASLWVTRCHHHEAILVRAELVVQIEEEPYVSGQQLLTFGPFDTGEEISNQAAALTQQFVSALQHLSIPSPAGPAHAAT